MRTLKIAVLLIAGVCSFQFAQAQVCGDLTVANATTSTLDFQWVVVDANNCGLDYADASATVLAGNSVTVPAWNSSIPNSAWGGIHIHSPNEAHPNPLAGCGSSSGTTLTVTWLNGCTALIQ